MNMDPFLSIPLRCNTPVRVSEGWIYSDFEQGVHGHYEHCAVDLAVDRGTEVLAPAAGLAIASYQLAYCGHYQGKRVGFGLGHFVEIWHPDVRLYTLVAHLERSSPAIRYCRPKPRGDAWVAPDAAARTRGGHRSWTPVSRGDVVGWAGDSGLCWGYDEGPASRPDPAAYPSWDEVHVHLEVFRRDPVTAVKVERLDPFRIYGTSEEYDLGHIRPDSLWLRKGAAPRYAGDAA